LRTTPALRATPPEDSPNTEENSPPSEGWQAQPDGVVPVLRVHQNNPEATS